MNKYTPEPINWKSGFQATMKKNWNQLESIAEEAKKANTIVGRYISLPYADGVAIYIVTEDRGEIVNVEVCTGLGDDWVIPYIGEKGILEKSKVLALIQQDEARQRLFKKR